MVKSNRTVEARLRTKPSRNIEASVGTVVAVLVAITGRRCRCSCPSKHRP